MTTNNNPPGKGFADAVQPISASTMIHTDAAGLNAGMVRISVGAEKLPAYRSSPAGAVNPPVILVVQEIFGVHEHIRDITRRLARQGFYAIAPELFFRFGDPSKASGFEELREKFVSKASDAMVPSDLDACGEWAVREGADGSRLGITGFCWGGRITWLYAAHKHGLKAAVAWYGRLAGDRSGLTPRHPVDVAGELHAPVLGLYGGQDPSIPPPMIDAMREALAKAGKTDSEIRVYPDAPHAFYADYRPSYRREAAEDGWQRMSRWFRSHGL